MTSVRPFFRLIAKNRILKQITHSTSTRTLFLGAHLNARTLSRKGGLIKSKATKPFVSPIVDLGDNIHELDFGRSSIEREEQPKDEPPEITVPKKAKKVIEHPLPFPFVRLQKNDHRLREVMMVVKSKKMRAEANLIMLEGKRLVEDALSAGVQPHCFFFSRAKDIAGLSIPTGDLAVPTYKVLYPELKLWSDLVTSPGVIGIFNVPKPNVVHPPEEAMPLTIICDNIRDPGNLGSILRVSAGVGSSKVILTKGCCDMWDTKVLRSSAGAHFRIPIENKVEWEDMYKHVSQFNHVFLADNNEALELKFQRPVSASKNHNVIQDESDSENDDDDYDDDDDEEEEEYQQSQFEFEMKALQESFANTTPYFEIDYTKRSPIVLILGGETHGISLEALKFARFQDSCSRLNIPLFNSVESLNSSVALSIITYEIQRQFILSNRSCSSNEPQNSEQFQKGGEN